MMGIYKITNKINNKVYVGQSWEIEKRWMRHKNNRKYYKDKNWHLYLSMNKYGIDNFEFSVLQEIDIIEKSEKDIQMELDELEDFYIIKFNSRNREFGYNKKSGGARGKHSKESNEKNRLAHLDKSVNKGVPKSEETKRKLSLNHPDRSGKNNPMFGKKHSKETKQKISEKAKMRFGEKNPFFGKHHTKETIEKIKRNRFKNKSKYKVLCHNNNKIYYSLNDVQMDLHLDCKKVSKICKGELDNFKGYTFSFINL